MVTTALVVAGISVAGFYLVYRKFPKFIRKWMHRHPLATDLTAAVATYYLFAGTITGLVAAAWTGVIVSIMLALTSNPRTEALMELYAHKIASLKDKFVEWAASKAPEQKEETPRLEVVNG